METTSEPVIARMESDHRRLTGDLRRLVAAAGHLETRQASHPSCPHGLAGHLADVLDALVGHIEKEERIAFPLIRAGAAAQAASVIGALEREHGDHDARLQRTRALTGGLSAPADAGAHWRRLYADLVVFENGLRDHVRLERDVLFRPALSA